MTQTALDNPGLDFQTADGPGGLARLQQMSRIAASTWRRWCELLKLSPAKATEVWEEICAPLEQVSGQRPNISYFLRLRAARNDVDIQSFKEEVAPLRHLLGFFRLLDDDSVDLDELPTALLRYYTFALEHTFRRQPFERFIDQWIYDVCRVFLVTKLCNAKKITLSRTLRLIAEERVHLEKLIQAATANAGDDERADKIRRFLSQTDDEATGTDGLTGLFRQVIKGIYKDEANSAKGQAQGPMRLEYRLRALHAFDPQRANLPSPEEAQAQSGEKPKAKSRGKTALAA